MYNRDFGGIRSDGQLYNMEQEYRYSQNEMPDKSEDCPPNLPEKPKQKGSLFGFLRDLKIDDLILIGIGILLLLDSEEDNDIIVLIIALLLFF